MTSELFQRIRILDPVVESDRTTDVWVVDGAIAAVADAIPQSDLPADTHLQDGSGLILGTGLIDLYSHSGEPGFESRETLASLMAAASAGGFTRVAVLPDTDPAVDNPSSVAWIQSRSKHPTSTLYSWGALTLGAQGEQMAELAELAAARVVGFADGLPLQNGSLLRRILEYGQHLGKPIALWCCDRGITGNGVVRDGVAALQLGVAGSPAIAETAPLATVLEFVAELEVPVHLMRVSTARSVALIRLAKAQGLPVTASTTWMHLLLDILDVQSYDPSLRLDPPLGNPSDRQALIQGIQDGTIDAIAIDHSPYTYEEKTVAFAEAPPGAIGLELALPLLWQTFVAPGKWEALTLWRSLSSNPARCLGQIPARIAPDHPAELTLFDPQIDWQVSPQTLHSLASNTPWLGQTLKGKVLRTFCGQ
ncbi:MAG: dihydroorotase [Oscillatoriophycideae cyanobacterium NC_groundwater_1537_Pr4_S-0.65um_50_18]|nr:dihydroorotase [Oscillatoriophycideae cyanobacterium NC_groundwater_1537_Pr4_S-0.65um_50_18]